MEAKNITKKSLRNLTVLTLCFVILCPTLSGCTARWLDSHCLSRYDNPYQFSVFASSCVPICPDSQWDEIYEIENDKYGRVLFVYVCSNNNSKNPFDTTYWVFVCHKSSDKFVYYYDDAFLQVSSKTLSDDELNEIKSINDWNKPINESCLSKTVVTDTYCRYDTQCEDEVLDLFNAQPENHELAYSVCTDNNGNSLFLYTELKKEEKWQLYKEYVVMRKWDGTFVYKEIDLSIDYTAQISEFKKANDWDSSCCTVIFVSDSERNKDS